MDNMKYVYGPVPSRRLGISLGVSPIPNKTCNYSCIYCQLGRTNHLTNIRKLYIPVHTIIEEFTWTIEQNIQYDVITIVGEGEPTLYLGLGELIDEIHKVSTKPIAVITNGALLYDDGVKRELMNADFVLPSLDASNEFQFKTINRPHKKISYEEMLQGLIDFSNLYKGELWLEMMLIKGINDDLISLKTFSEIIKKIKYSRLYINSPIRPPAECEVEEIEDKEMEDAIQILGGISIDQLMSDGFHSEVKDDYEALMTIIKRHPMNQYEILEFLKRRHSSQPEEIIARLNASEDLKVIYYRGYNTYRVNH